MNIKFLRFLPGLAVLAYLSAPILTAQTAEVTPLAQTLMTAPSGTATPQAATVGAASTQTQPSILRVGVVLPATQMGQGVQAPGIAEQLRILFLQQLAGPTVQAVPMLAVQPLQVDTEAKANHYQYILYSTISQKKSGGAGLSMLRNAAPMLSMVPMFGAAASVGGMIASQAASVAATEGVNAAAGIKAKSEFTLAYKLVRPGVASPMLENSLRAKARTDGEDIITPLLSQAVANTLGEIAKQR